MTPFGLALMILQAAIFVIWAVLMFRAMFGILGRFRKKTGRRWLGPISVFGAYGEFLTAPETRTERRRLGIATLLLIAATVALAYLRTP